MSRMCGYPVKPRILASVALLLATGMASGSHFTTLAAGTDVPVGRRHVLVDPPEAPPFGSVRVFGVRCGGSWGKDNLVGFELNSLEDPPTADEGVSLWARDIVTAPDGSLSATFKVPEIAPGSYFLFYLCASGAESRAFRAVPPTDRFLVIRRLPIVRAPPRVDPLPLDFLLGALPLVAIALIPAVGLGARRLTRRYRRRRSVSGS